MCTFPLPGTTADAKACGVSKNLTSCIRCKKDGQIISLMEEVKKLDYEMAKKDSHHLLVYHS
jgi:hypothetical protein